MNELSHITEVPEKMPRNGEKKMEGKVIRIGTMRVDNEELTGVFVEIPMDDMKNAKMMLYRTVNLTGAEDKNEPENRHT